MDEFVPDESLLFGEGFFVFVCAYGTNEKLRSIAGKGIGIFQSPT
jgi:hypothetical protein